MKKTFTLFILLSIFLGTNAQQFAENFTITDTQGNSYTLYEELNKGKTVVIDFFGLECGSCQTDMGDLEQIWQANGAGNGDVWIWAYDTYGGSDYQVEDFVNINGGTFPAFKLNAQDSIMKKFQVTYVPFYYVICPNGFVKSSSIGNIQNHIDACATLNIEESNTLSNQLISVIAPQASGFIDVNFSLKSNTKVSVELYDLLGNKIESQSKYFQAGLHQTKLNRSRLSSGYYFIRLTDNHGMLETKRIVIN